jgi:hypothetical protein
VQVPNRSNPKRAISGWLSLNQRPKWGTHCRDVDTGFNSENAPPLSGAFSWRARAEHAPAHRHQFTLRAAVADDRRRIVRKTHQASPADCGRTGSSPLTVLTSQPDSW